MGERSGRKAMSVLLQLQQHGVEVSQRAPVVCSLSLLPGRAELRYGRSGIHSALWESRPSPVNVQRAPQESSCSAAPGMAPRLTAWHLRSLLYGDSSFGCVERTRTHQCSSSPHWQIPMKTAFECMQLSMSP